MNDNPYQADDETAISEITILPDGRVLIFGLSREVLEVLEVLNPQDPALQARIHVSQEENA